MQFLYLHIPLQTQSQRAPLSAVSAGRRLPDQTLIPPGVPKNKHPHRYMSLPMFDKKHLGTVMVARKGKTMEAAPEVHMDPEDSDLREAAMDLLSAIERKNVEDVSKALRAAYEICESGEPDDEMGE